MDRNDNDMGWLVLTRRLGDAIRVTTPSGEVIRLKVARVDRGKVRLAFQADKAVNIVREELVKEVA